MRAYVQMEYSVDGATPSQVERSLAEAGFRREGPYYVAEGNDLMEQVSRLHQALLGTGVRYTVVPNPAGTERWSGSVRDVAVHWREDGLLDDAALELLETDPPAFREAARHTAGAAIDRLARLREEELRERRAQSLRRAEREDVVLLLRATGGMSPRQIMEALDAQEEELRAVLAEMVRSGEVSAEQVDSTVVYRLAERAAPSLR